MSAPATRLTATARSRRDLRIRRLRDKGSSPAEIARRVGLTRPRVDKILNPSPEPRYRKHKLSPGDRFGRLTVLERETGDPRHFNHYLCVCDCGQKRVVLGAKLGLGDVKSCGCLVQEVRSANGKKNRLPEGQNSTRNSIIRSYRRACAAGRGLPCTLTDEEFVELFQQRCAYCGTPPTRTAQHKPAASSYTFNGIDRIDNRRGYERGNVVSCCLCCNRAKGKMSVEEFTAWIECAYLHLRATGAIVAGRGVFDPARKVRAAK